MGEVSSQPKAVREGSAKFLRDRDVAPARRQPHLVRWVREFLLFAGEHRGYTSRLQALFEPFNEGGSWMALIESGREPVRLGLIDGYTVTRVAPQFDAGGELKPLPAAFATQTGAAPWSRPTSTPRPRPGPKAFFRNSDFGLMSQMPTACARNKAMATRPVEPSRKRPPRQSWSGHRKGPSARSRQTMRGRSPR